MDILGKLSNVNGWLYFFIIIAFIIFTFLVVRLGIKTFMKGENTKGKFFISLSILIISFFFVFLNFGSGKPPAPKKNVKETQDYKKLQEESGDSMTEKELKEDADSRKMEELKIQSDDSLREIYIEKNEKESQKDIDKYLNDGKL